MLYAKVPDTRLVIYIWMLLILVLMLIPIVILTAIFVIPNKVNTQSTTANASSMEYISNEHNLSMKGLLTMDRAMKENICQRSETIENCVLMHNAEIFMNTFLLLSSSSSSNRTPISSSSNSNKATKNTIDRHCVKFRRSQLAQIFDPTTLAMLFNLSGISQTPKLNERSSQQIKPRSQIDAHSATNKWNTSINYFINQTTGFTSLIIHNIRTAISIWENHTCLKFHELSIITPLTDKSYILFQRDDEYGCSSAVGYDKTDPTSVILIASYCGTIIGSIMHEIGHALGFIHTQSRIDRDSYVSIATSNIIPNYVPNYFIWIYGTLQFNDLVFPYDFGSIMHYDAYGFSKNNLPTIIAHDRRYEKTMGQRETASFYDYKQINRLYCTRADCPQMFSNVVCRNNGYRDPTTCTSCVCPDGLSGVDCSQRDPNSNCGATIINENPRFSTQITIQNPFPNSTTSVLQYCVYLFQSLFPRKIRLRLDSIRTAQRSICSLTSLLEIKNKADLALTGARWCGNNITSDWLNITAETNTMIVIFRANNSINITTGDSQSSFRATIFFDPELPPDSNLPAISTTMILSNVTSVTQVPEILKNNETTASSKCPLSSFRCRLPLQPTCGGCMSSQPCITQGTQQCTAYTYRARLTDCFGVLNGTAQCRYEFIQTPYITTCQRTVLLCCPHYKLISIGANYSCIYGSGTVDLPNEWSYII